ncbi:outer membrane lipoprotein carrier protein LolA [Baekduia soli]|uniref:Outer membrane lipoprotein carrier protein LolA n=1 Tax=Baekduia soli TaxID=496014 RepID=A0A5B8UBL4_9ACTN|nr:outer membrane lipoprotein carrier protein LolA [Baekduia soli]QEC50384.1 outer membrane lipoprotein carrier protein LolA [Baekduia soli]
MLRRLPTSRLLLVLGAAVAILAGGTALAMAALGGSGPTPPAKPLDAAVHDALSAPAVQGVTARITFTNRLIDKSSLPGGANPLLSGATGRLWAAADGRVRLELQSDNGDAQIVSDGDTVTIYDGTLRQAYRITLPAGAGPGHAAPHAVPALQKIDELLARVAQTADLSGAKPSDIAGRAAYTVRVSPKHDGGLVGAAELAFDAANGTPLRVAVYASGDPSPVLELEATDISYGRVPTADLSAPVPAGTKVTTVDLGGHAPAGAAGGRGGASTTATTPQAVAKALAFPLSAPDTLVGLPRRDVRVVASGQAKGALVTYGQGLGGIAVLEQAAPAADAAAGGGGGAPGGLSLPKVSIDGASGEELATALGTVVRFERGGVQYTVIGSVPPSAAEAAARAL